MIDPFPNGKMEGAKEYVSEGSNTNPIDLSTTVEVDLNKGVDKNDISTNTGTCIDTNRTASGKSTIQAYKEYR